MVHGIEFDDYEAALAVYDANSSGDFDSDEEAEAALDGGIVGATDSGGGKAFEGSVIPLSLNNSSPSLCEHRQATCRAGASTMRSGVLRHDVGVFYAWKWAGASDGGGLPDTGSPHQHRFSQSTLVAQPSVRSHPVSPDFLNCDALPVLVRR